MNKYRLVGMGMVRNEADIIEQFVRHSLSFLDELYLIDNGSVDGTYELLDALYKEGLPITYSSDPRFSYAQSEMITALYRDICRGSSPDYVFPLDADEFLAVASRQDLEEALSGIDSAGKLVWKTHLYAEGGDPDPVRRMKLRRREEHPTYYKVVLHGNQPDYQHVTIYQGAHLAIHDQYGTVPTTELASCYIAHFPVRDLNQIVPKAVLGWLSYLAKDPTIVQTGNAYQWRMVYQRILDSPMLGPEELTQISLNYCQLLNPPLTTIDPENSVLDPLPVSYSLRYSEHLRPSPVAIVAQTFQNCMIQGDLFR